MVHLRAPAAQCCPKVYRQEEQAEEAAAGAGEDPCHLSAYKRRRELGLLNMQRGLKKKLRSTILPESQMD